MMLLNGVVFYFYTRLISLSKSQSESRICNIFTNGLMYFSLGIGNSAPDEVV